MNNVLANPTMLLKRRVGNVFVDFASNDDWEDNANAADIKAATAAIGAFPLGAGSTDAALLLDLPPGVYTVVASGVDNGTGIALLELYDAEPDNHDSRLINISTRGFVGTGDNIMIPGYVISSGGPRTLLVRAAGPALGKLGVSDTLADPRLTILRRENNGTNTPVGSNDDWSLDPGAATTAATAAQVGAFPFAPGSKDAAIVVTLNPGVYTVLVSGTGNQTGTALVEIYEVATP